MIHLTTNRRLTYRCSAFTLLELLVVIVIIAILAALVVPSMKRSFETAERMDSIAKMRGLYSALNLYSGENENKYPDVWSNPDPSGKYPGKSWDVPLFPYLENFETAMHVKRDRKHPRTAGAPRSFTLSPSVVNLMGWLPTFISDNFNNLAWNTGINRLTVKAPSKFCLLFEAFHSGNIVGETGSSVMAGPVGDSPNLNDNLENTGFYFLLADGHVEWHGPVPTWAEQLQFTQQYGNPGQ